MLSTLVCILYTVNKGLIMPRHRRKNYGQQWQVERDAYLEKIRKLEQENVALTNERCEGWECGQCAGVPEPAALQLRHDQLLQECKELQSKLEELNAQQQQEMAELVTQSKKLNKDLKERNSECDDLTRQFNDLKSSNEECLHQNRLFQSQIEELTEKISICEGDKEKSTKQINDSNDAVQKLKEKLSEDETRHKNDAEHAEHRIKQLSLDNEKLQEEVTKLKSEAGDAKSELEELNENNPLVVRNEMESNEKDVIIRDLMQQIAILKQQFEDKDARIHALEVAKMRECLKTAELEKMKIQFEDRIQTLDDDLANQTRSSVQKENDSLSKHGALSRELDCLRQENEELRARFVSEVREAAEGADSCDAASVLPAEQSPSSDLSSPPQEAAVVPDFCRGPDLGVKCPDTTRKVSQLERALSESEIEVQRLRAAQQEQLLQDGSVELDALRTAASEAADGWREARERVRLLELQVQQLTELEHRTAPDGGCHTPSRGGNLTPTSLTPSRGCLTPTSLTPSRVLHTIEEEEILEMPRVSLNSIAEEDEAAEPTSPVGRPQVPLTDEQQKTLLDSVSMKLQMLQFSEEDEATSPEDATHPEPQQLREDQQLLQLQEDKQVLQLQLIYKKDQYDNLMDRVKEVAGVLGVLDRPNNVDDFCDVIVKQVERVAAMENGDARGNESLKQSLSAKDEEIASAAATQKCLDAKISELQQDYYELMESKSHLEKSLLDIEGELKEVKDKAEYDAAEMNKLEESLSMKQNLIQELESDKIELCQRLEDLEVVPHQSNDVKPLKTILLQENNLSKIVSDVKSLQSTHDLNMSAKCELAALREKNTSAQSQIHEHEKTIKDMTEERDTLKRRLNETQNELQCKEHEAEQTELESGNLKTSLRELTVEMSKIQLNLIEAQAVVDDLKQKLESKASECDQLRSKVSEVNEELASTRSTSEDFTSKFDDLEKRLTSIRDEREQYRTQAEKLHEELSSTQSESEDSKSRIDGLEKQLQSIRDECEQYKTQSEELNEKLASTLSEFEASRSEIDVLEKQLQRIQDEREQYKTQAQEVKDKLESTRSEFASSTSGINNLEKQLQSIRDECEQYKSQVEELNKILASTPSKSDDSASSIAHLEKQLQSVRDERERYKTRIEEVNEKLASAQSTSEADEGRSAELEQRLAAAEAALQGAAEAAAAEKQQLIGALTQKHAESVAYHAEIQRLSALLAQVQADNQKEIKELGQQQESSKSDLANLEKQVQTYKREISELQNQAENARRELLEKQKQLRESKEETGEVKKQLQLLTDATTLRLTQETEKAAAVESELRRQLQESAKSLLKLGSEREASEDSFNRRVAALSEEFGAQERQAREELQRKHAEVEELKIKLMSVTAEMKEIQSEASEKHSSASNQAVWEYEARLSEAHKENEALSVQLEEARKQTPKSNSLASTDNEVLRLEEEVSALTAKLEAAVASAAEQQAAMQQLTAADAQLQTAQEAAAKGGKETARLKQHLMEIEAAHTAEAVAWQQQAEALTEANAELRGKLEAHSRLLSSTSSRASSTVTELQASVAALQEERQRLQEAERGERERAEWERQRADTLKQVLEEFQRGEGRAVAEAVAAERQRWQASGQALQAGQHHLHHLQAEVARLGAQLEAAEEERRRGERATQQLALVTQRAERQEALLQQSRQQLQSAAQRSEARVDRELLRNLFLGYMTAAAHERAQVLPVLAGVLGMSEEERGRLGVGGPGGRGWMSSLADFLAPPASNVRVTSRVDVLGRGEAGGDSLSDALVRYMEAEGKAGARATLPALRMATERSNALVSAAEAQPQTVTLVSPSGAPPPPHPDRPSTPPSPSSDPSATPLYLSNLLNTDRSSPV